MNINSNKVRHNGIIVVGGSMVTPTEAGGWGTKLPFRDYLTELREYTSGLIFIAPINPKPFKSAKISERISVVPIRSGLLGHFSLIRHVLKGLYKTRNVLLHYPTCLPLAPVLRLIRTLTSNLTVYISNDYQADSKLRGRNPFHSYMYKKAYNSAIIMADIVIVRGRYLHQVTAKLNHHVVQTVPIANLFNHSNSELQKINRHPGIYILYLGNILYSKGVAELIKAVGTLPPCLQKYITLDLVGDGKDRDELENLPRNQQLVAKINFHGHVSDLALLEGFWQCADVLVVPSIMPEGVPRVIDEALFRGVPVIASCVGGIPQEFKNDEVVLVPPADILALAKTITRVLADPSARNVLSRNASERVRSWRKTGSAAKQHASLILGKSNGVTIFP